MASIRWENVTKDFGRVIAVKELNLECKDGEFMALLGPSGCGKTTTLRMTAGLETPTSGTIYFDDKPINHLAPRERNIAMVFENYALYPHRTVYKNISYPLEILKLPPKQIDEKVHYAAKLLEIDPLLNRYPKEISGGQTSASASRARWYASRRLLRWTSRCRTWTPNSALTCAQRAQAPAERPGHHHRLCHPRSVGSHHDGRSRGSDEPGRFAAARHTPGVVRPAKQCLRREVYRGAVHEPAPLPDAIRGRQELLVGEGMHVTLTPQARQKVLAQTQSTEMLFGARPQHITVHHGTLQGNGQNIVTGSVYVSEPLGAEQLVRVRVGKEIVSILTEDTLMVDMDEAVSLVVAPDRFFLFDAQSEKRVL